MNIGVGLDVDGPIADMQRFVLHKLGLSPAKLITWDIAASFGSRAKAAFYAVLSDPATWVSVPPTSTARKSVRVLVGAGVTPVFISSAYDWAFELRRWWLNKHFGDLLPTVYLYLCHADEKPALAKSLFVTHFVEDKRTTANAIAEAGLNSILIPSTYHTDNGEKIDPRVRIQTLLDFAREVKEAASANL